MSEHRRKTLVSKIRGLGAVRAVLMIGIGALIGTMLLTPVSAHVSNNLTHNWNKHYKSLAQRLFFTKKQTNQRFALKNHGHEGLIESLNQLDGLPCTLDGDPGQVELSFDGSEASFVCQVLSDAECVDGATQQCGSPPAGACLGIQTCVDGEWGTCSGGSPSEEVCDGIDNNCDGQVDEGLSCGEVSCAGQAAGTVCRPAAHGCDSVEVCDGINDQCPADALAEEGTPCSDGDACTEGDVCSSGTCSGTAKSCDDGNECTNDVCTAEGCMNEPAQAGQACGTGGQACDGAGTCVSF